MKAVLWSLGLLYKVHKVVPSASQKVLSVMLAASQKVSSVVLEASCKVLSVALAVLLSSEWQWNVKTNACSWFPLWVLGLDYKMHIAWTRFSLLWVKDSAWSQGIVATSVIDNATAVICCELLLYEWHRILSVVVSVTSLAMLQNTSSCQVLCITLLGISPENANSYQSMGNVGTVVFSKSWTSCGFCCCVMGTAVQDCWNVSVWSTVHPWVWLINNLWVSDDAIVFFVCMRMYECCVSIDAVASLWTCMCKSAVFQVMLLAPVWKLVCMNVVFQNQMVKVTMVSNFRLRFC